MAISINWGTRVITVPQGDLLQVQASPIEVYELNINDFRLALRDLEDDVDGIPFPDTHIHVAPITVAGVTLARIVEIINGYTVTFEPDLPYGVNLVGGNSNIADVTNPNNVSVRSANSAGLQDSTSLQAASFGGHVTIDVTSGITGTTFPRGTDRFPVDNLADALAIAEFQGLVNVRVVSSLTVGATDLSDGYTFYSDRIGVTAAIDPAANVTNCSFHDIGVTGALDSNNQFYRCEVFNATSLQAVLTDCGITGTLTLGGGLTELINCHSGVAGGGPGQFAAIDMGATGSDLLVRDYSGGLAIENLSDATADVSIDMDSGRLTVASDVTDGTVTVRGIAEVVDNSTGTAVVDDRTLTADVAFVQKILRNRRETDPLSGVQRIYDDDNATVLIQGDLWEDIAGTQPYQGQGADRADRMA